MFQDPGCQVPSSADVCLALLPTQEVDRDCGLCSSNQALNSTPQVVRKADVTDGKHPTEAFFRK